MALEYAILGILNLVGPQSGYDVSTNLIQSAGNVWHADRPQIYRTLNKLEAQGYAVSAEDEDNARGRKVYQLTNEGRAALRTWLAEAYEFPVVREPNMLKLFFGTQIAPPRLREQIQEYRARLIHQHKDYQLSATLIDQNLEDFPDDAFFWGLTLDLGRRSIQMQIEWCDHVLTKLDEREASSHLSDPQASGDEH